MEIVNINFVNNSSQHSGRDFLQFTVQFSENEINHTYLGKIYFRRIGPGSKLEVWDDLTDFFVESDQATKTIVRTFDISTTTGFQQGVQFKVLLIPAIIEKESKAFQLKT